MAMMAVRAAATSRPSITPKADGRFCFGSPGQTVGLPRAQRHSREDPASCVQISWLDDLKLPKSLKFCACIILRKGRHEGKKGLPERDTDVVGRKSKPRKGRGQAPQSTILEADYFDIATRLQIGLAQARIDPGRQGFVDKDDAGRRVGIHQ